MLGLTSVACTYFETPLGCDLRALASDSLAATFTVLCALDVEHEKSSFLKQISVVRARI